MSKTIIDGYSGSKLYKQDFYISNDYDYILSKKITEYDIKSAGLNLCKYYNLLPNDEIKRLEELSKKQRQIAIGKLMRDDKEFNEKCTKSFKHMRKMFFRANKLVDDDILSIKKDAIFIVSKKCKKCKFENVEFVEKNVYTSYHKFGNIELYYNSKTNILDVKGINNDLLYQHTSFINILKRIFRMLENNNVQEFTKFMLRFVDDYKNKRLSYDYYREFNANSMYSLINTNSVSNYVITVPNMDQTIDNNLDISYNYINYILPIIQRFYFNNIGKKGR